MTDREHALRERVAKLTAPPDERGCMQWLGSRVGWGYGRVRHNGGAIRTHRLVWEWANGPIPDGLYVLHRCDNPLCVNPEHLFLGTNLDNVRDRDSKGRQARGESHGAKLTEQQVAEIRARYVRGIYGFIRLAKEYGVCQRTIQRIVNREKWTHV